MQQEAAEARHTECLATATIKEVRFLHLVQRRSRRTGKAAATKAGPKLATPPWSTDVNDWYQMQEDLAAELDKK